MEARPEAGEANDGYLREDGAQEVSVVRRRPYRPAAGLLYPRSAPAVDDGDDLAAATESDRSDDSDDEAPGLGLETTRVLAMLASVVSLSLGRSFGLWCTSAVGRPERAPRPTATTRATAAREA